MGWWETGQVKILTSKPSIKTTDIKFLNYHAERKGRGKKKQGKDYSTCIRIII